MPGRDALEVHCHSVSSFRRSLRGPVMSDSPGDVWSEIFNHSQEALYTLAISRSWHTDIASTFPGSGRCPSSLMMCPISGEYRRNLRHMNPLPTTEDQLINSVTVPEDSRHSPDNEKCELCCYLDCFIPSLITALAIVFVRDLQGRCSGRLMYVRSNIRA